LRRAAEQFVEEPSRPCASRRWGHAFAALRVIAGEQRLFHAGVIVVLLLIGAEIGAHLRDAGVDLAALWRRRLAEEKKLLTVAADPARIVIQPAQFVRLLGDGAIARSPPEPARAICAFKSLQ